MRWIRAHSKVNELSGCTIESFVTHPKMVFYIPRTFVFCGQLRVELCEQLFKWLAAHIG